MHENHSDQEKHEPFGRVIGIRETLGIILVVIGTGVALWVFANVYEIFTSPQKLTAYQKLVSQNPEGSLATKDSSVKLVIPPKFLAYLIPILLLGIGVSIAGILITGGVGLAHGAYQKFSLRVARSEDKTLRAVQHLKDWIKNRDEGRKPPTGH